MKTKHYLIILFIFIFFYKNVLGAFYFSEIMPNVDQETIDEYVEITYDGKGTNNLNGYRLSDKTGKEYIFGDDLFLPDESKKYYRPQTMVVLNNSDEEIYLKDNFGNLIDSFYYATSKKGEAIKIERKEEVINDIGTSTGELEQETSSGSLEENEFIQENNEYIETNSGSLNEDLNENQPEDETGSGELNQEESESQNTNSGVTQETPSGNIEVIQTINLDIKNTFQSPTYLLEKDTILSDGFTYNCDRTKDDCRVNFDFRTTFSSLKESDFNCISDFGLGGITGEENKCNPNTIIFPIGTTNIKINISHKTKQNHFGEMFFKIKNEGKQVQTNTSSTTIFYSNPNQTNISKPKLEIISPIIEIQSGLDKDNTCNKKECSINFLYEKTHKDLVCSWDFGEDIDGKGNENKCNPNSVYFGPGKHEVFLEICDKNKDDNCKKSIFIFENKYKTIEPKAIITLQGRLSKNKLLINNKITCLGSDNCSINFDGSESLGEELTYFWDFGNGQYFEGKNPKSMIFEVGIYQIILEISDEYGNYSQDFFEVEVIGKEDYILNVNESDIDKENQTLSSLQEKQINLLKINLQGKLGSNKILGENKITCIKTCSINFDGSESIGEFTSYFWDFGNGETYVGKNPSYISYKDFGKYSVVFSGETKSGELIEKEFFVEYYKSLPKVESDKNDFVNEDKENFIEQDNYYEEDISIEEYDNKKNKDLIISIFIFIFLGFILGLFVLKKYKII